MKLSVPKQSQIVQHTSNEASFSSKKFLINASINAMNSQFLSRLRKDFHLELIEQTKKKRNKKNEKQHI